MPQAKRNLLQIIQTVQRELGLFPLSTQVIGNTNDLTSQQLLGYAQSEIEALGRMEEHDWTCLTFEHNLVVNPPLVTTGDMANNSPIVTNIPDTSTLSAIYYSVSGDYIPVGTRIKSIDSATQVTLTMNATGDAPGGNITFAQDMYPEPSDFDHFIGNTWWDRSNRWQLLGPMSPQVDQWHLSGVVATGPRRFFRQIGPYSNNYRIWPPPAEIVNPLQLVFEYQSSNRVRVRGSSTEFAFFFENDDDVPLLDDRLIVAGVKWRFWEQKGYNWLSKRKEYNDMVKVFISRDGGSSIQSLARQPTSTLVSSLNVQDGFWPGPTGTNME